MGAAALPLMIIGTAVQAYGAYQQGEAASEAASYNAKVSEQNAQMAESQGAAAAQSQQRQAQRQIGAALASYGASGIDLGSGSPIDVLQDSVRQSVLDNASVKYDYDARAQSYRSQSELQSAQASQASTSGFLSSLGSLAKGADSYMKYQGLTIPGMGQL